MRLSEDTFQVPPADRSQVQVAVDAKSDRFQLLNYVSVISTRVDIGQPADPPYIVWRRLLYHVHPAVPP